MKPDRYIKPFRAAVLVALPLLFACALVLSLYDLQVLRTETFAEESRNTVLSTETVPAARGDILDRYGRVLVSNRLSCGVAIDRLRLVADPDPNGVLLRLIALVTVAGVPYADSLPVSADEPYAYTAMSAEQSARLADYAAHFMLAEGDALPDAPALMAWFREHYEIPADYTPAEARLAAGVRYELELRALFHIADYLFASDLDVELVSAVSERSFPGVSIVTSAVRDYHTSYAAHLLGRTGLMNAEEVAYYGGLGYPMNATVGKDGAERAFEEYLHGVDGERVTIRSADGEIVDSYYIKEPRVGGDVSLTIDLSCQQAAEEALSGKIAAINKERLQKAGEDETVQLAQAGAVAVVQVGTGDVLALASYPSYDLAHFNRDYAALSTDPAAPLYNRAIQGAYAPGSTFKAVTATAALAEGVITPETTIYDRGVIDEYEGYRYTCWAYPGSHGTINVKEALQMSCNYFFYKTGRDVGIDKLAAYAAAYGLGQATGIELPEKTGVLASREYKAQAVQENWYVGDTLQAAIGQSYNLFTPLQLASYAATVASGGVRYAAHLLQGVSAKDQAAGLYAYEPQVLSRVDAPAETFQVVREGLLMASKYGSASYVFGNYGVDVCSKTGTAQVSEDTVNNAVFIAFAPMENPEIALSVVVENGANGYYLAEVARDIFNWYFSRETEAAPLPEGVLLP